MPKRATGEAPGRRRRVQANSSLAPRDLGSAPQRRPSQAPSERSHPDFKDILQSARQSGRSALQGPGQLQVGTLPAPWPMSEAGHDDPQRFALGRAPTHAPGGWAPSAVSEAPAADASEQDTPGRDAAEPVPFGEPSSPAMSGALPPSTGAGSLLGEAPCTPTPVQGAAAQAAVLADGWVRRFWHTRAGRSHELKLEVGGVGELAGAELSFAYTPEAGVCVELFLPGGAALRGDEIVAQLRDVGAVRTVTLQAPTPETVTPRAFPRAALPMAEPSPPPSGSRPTYLRA